MNKPHPHIYFKYKYPKLTLFLLITIGSYFIFTTPLISSFFAGLGKLGYLSIFIAGILFSFGFTTPLAIGMFLTITPQSIIPAALLGGFGAMLGDLLIFNVIKMSFMKEFKSLENERFIKFISKEIDKLTNPKIHHYLLYAFAGIVISSPLPDELGVSLLAGLTKINQSALMIISFIFNSIGILILLLI